MSKRDRQIQDPFEQQDGAGPIDRPEPDGYMKIIQTAKAEADRVADDVTQPPVAEQPTGDGFELTEFTAVDPTIGQLDKSSPKMESGLLDASSPKVRKDSGEAHVADEPQPDAMTLNYTEVEVVAAGGQEGENILSSLSTFEEIAAPTERSLCNNESEADVVGQAVEQGLVDGGQYTEQPEEGLDYLTITMTNVVDDAVDG